MRGGMTSTLLLGIRNAGATHVPQLHCAPDQFQVPTLVEQLGQEIRPSWELISPIQEEEEAKQPCAAKKYD